MLFRTYARLLTFVLSVCIITTTTPTVASQAKLELDISEEDLSEHLDLAESHLAQAENHKVSKMDIKLFEKNLDRTLNHLQRKTDHKIDHASDAKIALQYKKMKDMYLNSSDEVTKNRILDIDKKDLSTRDKLRELNADGFKDNVKIHMLAQIKEAGSVKNYIKQVRQTLKEARQNAQGGQAGGISLGSLLLITGIILVVLGPAVVGASWVTIGWVFIAVFGIVPLAILLVILIIAIIAAVVSENKTKFSLEFKPWEPAILPPFKT